MTKITLNLDNVNYKSKDAARTDAGALSNRLRNKAAIKTITPDEFIQAVSNGQTFTPAILEGSTADTWKAQQIICADIDNDDEGKDADGNKKRLPNPLTPPLAMGIMLKYGIKPYFMYYSFSSTITHQKFRIVLILDEPITDAAEAEELGRRFTAIFNRAVNHCADTTVNENARLFFGTTPDRLLNVEKEITPLATLRNLPKPEDITAAKPEPIKREYKEARNATPRKFTDYEAQDRQFNIDKENFNIAEYIEATTANDIKRTGRYYTVNPCPICGHNDDFKIPVDKPHLFKCFGANGDTGGTIIDYLIIVNNWEISQAINYFKYDIMNYERPERKPTEAAPSTRSEADEPTEAPAEEEKTIFAQTATEYLTAGIFEKDIEYFKQYKDRKTGFEAIDKYLTLYPGLAALGGASSLGKTTFIVNLIDNLLYNGETVLYFSLEQLPIEIITKSLTRRLYEEHPDTKLTNIDIKNGATCAELERIKKEYADDAENYHIIPGTFRTTAADIVKYVETFRAANGGEDCKPIVIIDYLQLIAPPEGFRGDTRATTDENIKILKDFQKRNELFVIFVSSFNRSSNLEPIAYDAFKETSMIEYTCDYVWGLQLQIQDADNNEFYTVEGSKGGIKERQAHDKKRLINEAQNENPKKVQFVSIKSRNGKQFYKADFDYYPQYDCFVPEGEKAKPSAPWSSINWDDEDDEDDWEIF